MNLLTHYDCPKIPDWLKAIDDSTRAMNQLKPPADHLKLLELYRGAFERSARCATEFAERYESGHIPCGTSTDQAIVWHEYACYLGSASSKLRLAQLYLWAKRNSPEVENGILHAKELVAVVVMDKTANSVKVHAAAISAMLLLDNDGKEESLSLASELISHPHFISHPYHFTICERLKKLEISTNKSQFTLSVVHQKISNDGDFKIGIYKALEQPLNLVSVPNIDFIKYTLDNEFPWFEEVNAIVFRQLVMQQYSRTPVFKLRPLLIAGPPGVGKTSYVKRLSELCKVPFRAVMAAGASDSMFLKGTPRGWASARPSAVIQTMATELVANPIYLMDELEKASSDNRNGRIWDTLLQLLEPATSKVFLDECLCVPCDLSWVSWVATVNEIGALPKPLLERFTVVVVNAPDAEFISTLIKGAMQNFAQELDIDSRFLPQLDGHDLEIISRCNGPREINRMVRCMVEKKMVEVKSNEMRN